MKTSLKITQITGESREINLLPETIYTIGRARDNSIVLSDRQVSRHHAHVRCENRIFKIIDGYFVGNELRRSVNKVFVNGSPVFEKILQSGDRILIGETRLDFTESAPSGEEISLEPAQAERVRYDDQPLGHTQLLISANDIIGKHSNISIETNVATPGEIKELRRKAKVLELLYELSKMLGTVFDLKEIFARATDLIFRGTSAERVVALIADENSDDKNFEYSLNPIAVKARDEAMKNLTEKLTVSRTITQKVMRERIALLSQDARADAELSGAESIVSQGVRSTICAPLLTEKGVHGVVYADRLDPFAAFSSDDLELISAVAAQTAMVVETVKAHRRLAREEVARANYSRFMPEYVVKQLLENPDSFRLGGVNQQITVLFADIRGFTSLSESENPEKVVGLLNRYFTAMSEIIFAHGGTLDKYIGDGLMAIFGAPNVGANDAGNALKTAAAMQKKIVLLNEELRAEGFNEIGVGIGLHTGEATVGYIGSEKRSEYTAIGDTVNLAARLEQNALPGQILISEATANACRDAISFPLITHKPLTVKNRVQPVSLFEVKWN